MEWSLVHLIMQLPSFHCKMPLVDMYTRKLFIKKCKKSKKNKVVFAEQPPTLAVGRRPRTTRLLG